MPVKNKLLLDQLALEEKVDLLIARRLEWRIEMGRYLRHLKRIITKRMGHGHWETYLQERFGHSGIAARTARKYMRLAKRAETDVKTARHADLQPGVNPQAQIIVQATAKAKENLAKAKRPDFRFPVPLRSEEEAAAKHLLASPHRVSAQQEIAAVIRSRSVKYGFMEPPRFPRVA